MVHVSLRRTELSRLADGGAMLVAALDAAVGPDGGLLMVLGTDCPTDWVNDHPVETRAALLAGSPPFDPVTASVLPEVGAFAEYVRTAPGTIVNDNPSGRFAARGAAVALIENAPWHDYYGPDSPLARLVERGGKVLRLGADPQTATVLHYAEYLADLPAKRRTRWDYLLAGPDGPEHRWINCLDDAEGIADYDGEDYFAVIVKAYRADGRALTGRVGEADADLMDAADLVDFGARWMERNLA